MQSNLIYWLFWPGGSFPLFLGVYINGGIWEHSEIPANMLVYTHKRAIITLLRHRRESSGKPKEAEAQRGVNRKRVTHILVATHTYNKKKAEPKPRVPPHEARGKSVVTEQEEESFTSTHQFYSYWRCYHKREGVKCYVLEINECSQREAVFTHESLSEMRSRE